MQHRINLMYHDVYETNPLESGFTRERDLPYKVSLSSFRNQVMAISAYCRQHNINKESIVFTFDDGGSSFYYLIASVLEDFGYRGRFFITTQFIDRPNFMTKEEIIRLEERGHVVGSHADSHEHFYNLSIEQVQQEWTNSVSILSNILGHPIVEASIPNGDTSEIVLNKAYKVGLREIYTSRPTTRVFTYNSMKLYGRYVILSNTPIDYIISIISSSLMRNKIALRWRIIYYLKRLLGDKYVLLKNKFYKLKNNIIL